MIQIEKRKEDQLRPQSHKSSVASRTPDKATEPRPKSRTHNTSIQKSASGKSADNMKIMDDRDDMDNLPPYTNSLQLLSICRRKREFNSSFDKARRRNWEVVWLLLDGTALRVYEPLKEEKEAFEGRNLQQALSSSSALTRSRLDTPPTISSLHASTSTSLAAGPSMAVGLATGSLPNLSSTRVLQPSWKANCSNLERGSESESDLFGLLNSSRNSAALANITATSFLPPNIPKPDFTDGKRTLIRQYPVRHAICSKPDAYIKREYVLRFILEDGKQFLVQLNSKKETIAWLQFMSIAAPLALDLDERPMPEPAQYPRSRPTASRSPLPPRPHTAPAAIDSSRIRSTPSTSTGARNNHNRSCFLNSSLQLSQSSLRINTARPRNLQGGEQEVEERGNARTHESHEPHGHEEDLDIEMDHLPRPSLRPPFIRSLSSVDQARRLGVTI